MLKRTKNAISSTKGESYVFVCVIVLFISALVSVAIMYMGLMAQVQIQKRDVKIKLDNCITEYAVEAFDSLKQGESLESVIDLNKLRQNAFEELGFRSNEESYAYPNGNCTMSRPTVRALSGNGFGLTASYTASFAVIWGGRRFANLEVPITVTSYYKTK
ncbi:MAG: hypothetical protein IJD70_02475 [Clostridia bacterium]|nr:hypothetical protein [Clostridia bacterium]